jgi:hypothetical protein
MRDNTGACQTLMRPHRNLCACADITIEPDLAERQAGVRGDHCMQLRGVSAICLLPITLDIAP